MYKIQTFLCKSNAKHPKYEHLRLGTSTWRLHQIELPEEPWVMEFLLAYLPYFDRSAAFAETGKSKSGKVCIQQCIDKLIALAKASGMDDTLNNRNADDPIPEKNQARMCELLTQDDIFWCDLGDDLDMTNRQFVYDMYRTAFALQNLLIYYPLEDDEYYRFTN